MTMKSTISIAAILALGLALGACAKGFPGPAEDQIGNPAMDGPLPLGIEPAMEAEG